MKKHAIRETGKAGLPAADWVSCIRVVAFCEIYVECRGISRCIGVFRAASSCTCAWSASCIKKEPQRKKEQLKPLFLMINVRKSPDFNPGMDRTLLLFFYSFKFIRKYYSYLKTNQEWIRIQYLYIDNVILTYNVLCSYQMRLTGI